MSKDLDKKDLFTDKVKNKLAGYEVTPDPAVWDAVQARLKESGRSKRIVPVWWISTGMAAAVALLFVLNFTLRRADSLDKALSDSKLIAPEKSTFVNEKSVSKSTARVAEVNSTSKEIINPVSSGRKSLVEPTPSIGAPTPASKPENTFNSNSTVENKQNNSDTVEIIDPVSDESQKTIFADNSTTDSGIKKADSTNTTLPGLKKDWEDPLRKKRTDNWEMLAMVGASQKIGGAGNGNVNAFSGLRDGVFQASSALTNLEDLFPEFDDKTYFAPLTAGLSVSKMVSRNVFVESGLRYTYLHSQFSNSLSVADLHLHYIGVPLNLGYRINSGPNWYFYTSGGIMAEKGLTSVYRQTIRYSNNTVTTSKTESINGLQWSVNATVGVGYYLSRKFSLYFEPEFGYYFDNNQPLSSRTENQLTFGLKSGLRFHL